MKTSNKIQENSIEEINNWTPFYTINYFILLNFLYHKIMTNNAYFYYIILFIFPLDFSEYITYTTALGFFIFYNVIYFPIFDYIYFHIFFPSYFFTFWCFCCDSFFLRSVNIYYRVFFIVLRFVGLSCLSLYIFSFRFFLHN